MKKSATEAHRMRLSNTYGEAIISERTCREFQRFKNGDFDVQGHALYLVGPARRSVLSVQLCFRRFPLDGFSSKWWSK